jgi:outer membrane immunogenic protein
MRRPTDYAMVESDTGLSLLDHALGKMMKRILAAAFALSFGGTAFAADMPMPYKAAAPAPTFTWTGCYVGGNGGGGRAKDEWQPFSGTPLDTVRASGWFAGAQAGCDYQVSAFVFGIETQFDWADMQGIADIASGGGSSINELSSKLDRFATATGRIGYAFEHVLLYVKGGAVFAHYNHGFAQEATGFPLTTLFAGGQNVTGFVLGGGFEVAVLRNVSFKAEYNYMDFGTNTPRLDCVGTLGCSVATGLPFEIHQQAQTFMLGFNYRVSGLGWN